MDDFITFIFDRVVQQEEEAKLRLRGLFSFVVPLKVLISHKHDFILSHEQSVDVVPWACTISCRRSSEVGESTPLTRKLSRSGI